MCLNRKRPNCQSRVYSKEIGEPFLFDLEQFCFLTPLCPAAGTWRQFGTCQGWCAGTAFEMEPFMLLLHKKAGGFDF